MKKYYSSERLKEIIYTNKKPQDLFIYDRKNQVKLLTLIHDMDLRINDLQEENETLKDKLDIFMYNNKFKQETLDVLRKRIDKSYKKAQLIKDIGFDYDGYNDTENLKRIIDELVNLADDIQIILRGDLE